MTADIAIPRSLPQTLEAGPELESKMKRKVKNTRRRERRAWNGLLLSNTFAGSFVRTAVS